LSRSASKSLQAAGPPPEYRLGDSVQYVEVHNNLATIVGAGVDTFTVGPLPQPVGLMVAIRLVGLAEEFTADQERPMANRIRDPGGNTIAEAQGTFAIAAESARPDFLAGVTMPLGLAFNATEEGTYAVEFEFGDQTTMFPLHVVTADQAA